MGIFKRGLETNIFCFLGILTIPAPKYLDSLTSAFKVAGGTVEGDVPQSTKQYLKTRIISLSEKDKTVNMILDEVYTTHRVEYSSGKFYGYENQTVTKTLLGFMIKSVAGRHFVSPCILVKLATYKLSLLTFCLTSQGRPTQLVGCKSD